MTVLLACEQYQLWSWMQLNALFSFNKNYVKSTQKSSMKAVGGCHTINPTNHIYVFYEMCTGIEHLHN